MAIITNYEEPSTSNFLTKQIILLWIPIQKKNLKEFENGKCLKKSSKYI